MGSIGLAAAAGCIGNGVAFNVGPVPCSLSNLAGSSFGGGCGSRIGKLRALTAISYGCRCKRRPNALRGGTSLIAASTLRYCSVTTCRRAVRSRGLARCTGGIIGNSSGRVTF